MNLRFVMREGKKILQHYMGRPGFEDTGDYWEDVPLVEEPKKPREWTMFVANGTEMIKVREVIE